MSRIGIFMANGCEEIEGLTVVDILRRAGMEIVMISITEGLEIVSSHKVRFMADMHKDKVDYGTLDGIVLPGGMPGTLNLGADDTVVRVLHDFAQAGKLVAAICAAPSVLGQEHLLKGRRATCHPGFEDKLLDADWLEEPVVVDGNFITSRGMGTAIAFALEIVRYFADDATVEQIKTALVYQE